MRFIIILFCTPFFLHSQVYNSPCPYDNNARDTLDFSTAIVGASHDAIIWSGDYVIGFGMKASMTYGITTCIDPFNVRDNDSHITIYPHGGGQAIVFNDDACTIFQYHSTVLFSPPVDGDYDILFDEHGSDYCMHYVDVNDFFDYYIEVLSTTSVEDKIITENKIVKIIDLMGNETDFKYNTLLFYIYENGIVEKKITMK